MKRTLPSRTILGFMAAALLLGDLLAWAPPAEAQVNPVNAGLGLFRVLSAMNRRNRTYQAARDTERDFDAYYGSLQDTARAQLVSGDLRSLRQGESGLETVRVAAYVRLATALDAEQTAITRAIDAETNQARRDFNRTLGQELQQVIVQLPGAQQILGEVRSVISNMRTTVVALQAAAASNQPLDVLTQRLAEQVSSSSLVQDRVRELGSMLGPDLDRALGGALTQVNNTIADVNREANQAVTLLDGMDAQVASYDLSQARPPEREAEQGPATIQLTERATAVVDVASQALAFLSLMQSPGGTTREQLYTQIRQDLLNERNAELLNAAQHVSLVECVGVGRGEYEMLMGMLGKPPAIASDPENARYVVCTDRETGQPVRAFIVGGSSEVTATPDEGTPTVEPEIPVGTYVGTTTYPETFEVVRSVAENSVTVTVGPDGTVIGNLHIISDRSEVITRTCTTAFHQEYVGDLSGRLGRSAGHVDIRTVRSGTSAHCDGTIEAWTDPPNDWVVSLRVVGGVMTGAVIGFEGSDDVIFEFTANRQ
jgi:hypothetical protein